MSSRPCPGLIGGRMATAAIYYTFSPEPTAPPVFRSVHVFVVPVDLIIGLFFSTSNRAWCRPFAHGFPLPLPLQISADPMRVEFCTVSLCQNFHLVSQDLLLPFVKFLFPCFTYKLNPVCHFASHSRLLQPSSLLCWSVSV